MFVCVENLLSLWSVVCLVLSFFGCVCSKCGGVMVVVCGAWCVKCKVCGVCNKCGVLLCVWCILPQHQQRKTQRTVSTVVVSFGCCACFCESWVGVIGGVCGVLFWSSVLLLLVLSRLCFFFFFRFISLLPSPQSVVPSLSPPTIIAKLLSAPIRFLQLDEQDLAYL